MNILWITNTIFPAPSKELGLPIPVLGGWMYGMAMQLAATPNINLAVATTYNGPKIKFLKIDGVNYYLLPSKQTTSYQKKLEPFWKIVCSEFKPDIIHIHGTEFTHGLVCMHSCPSFDYVVSIQGMVGVYSRYYYANISIYNIIKHITFRDVIRFDTIFQGKIKFKNRGIYEEEYLKKACHVIGRTTWDYAHTKAINSNLNYHFCNESLRDSFYTTAKWDITKKKTYTLFLSQAGYPIKGLHQVIKAIARLKDIFPKINVRIAGTNIISQIDLLEIIKISGYGSYINHLVNRYNLKENVHFIGTLNEEQMITEYQNAHIFICPSSIENSPNSIGEAQLIGLPCIASYVGGIPDMIENGKHGLLYRFEEDEILTEHIRNIFINDILALKLSTNGIRVAEERHNRQTNLNNTLEIYHKIISK